MKRRRTIDNISSQIMRVSVLVLATLACCSHGFTLFYSTNPSMTKGYRNFKSSCSAKDDNNQDDDDNTRNKKQQQQKPINNLDIFGQPKGKQPRRIFEDEGDIRGSDRIKSCIPYMLPLIDGDSFGRFIYERIPPLGFLDYVLLRPFVEGFRAVPFLSILLFMTFALAPQLLRDSLSREVRFNAQQAVLIDVALIFPTIIGESIADEKIPRELLEPATNFVFIAYVSLVIYSVTSCLKGRKPDQIPYISSAAEFSVGPF